MISVQEAFKILRDAKMDFGIEEVHITKACGRILKEECVADRPFPPFDRVMMDGIAIQYDQFDQGQRSFDIESIAPAGEAQKHLIQASNTIEVMTGAVLPLNCDTVIRYEDVTIVNETATILLDSLTKGQNIHRKGLDKSSGDLLIPINTKISPTEIGIAATIGKSHLKVAKLPKVMMISTGDELVEIDQIPEDHQIRKSNVYSIKSLLEQHHISVDIAHLSDDQDEIESKLSVFLTQYDALILSGGVSMGKFDFIPKVLAELKVKKHFHKIKQRPGKPFWFGTKDNCAIFALPGNPNSSFMCATVYVQYWLSMCLINEAPSYPKAKLDQDYTFKPNLTRYLQVISYIDDKASFNASPMGANGSGDLANLAKVNAFMMLPDNKSEFKKGELYPVILYRTD